ncbi:type II toxin-antitoxin system mRNA interferase toxin, RelE/StbE family [Cyanosarcina cf. burmensis CCALA 770]|nr:type II toxin-antitoxin system mRNA interferase toxin, RelE/StbE family [Cyanosarcina cf. burmensis CCALA 770]
MTYQVEFSRQAQKQFDALPRQIQQRLQPQIDTLAEEPRPSGVKKLKGAENQYRIRVGSYRIVYEIQDAVLLIILLRIGHRREIYR